MSLREELEFVQNGQVLPDDLIDDVLNGRLFAIAELVSADVDLLELLLEELDQIGLVVALKNNGSIPEGYAINHFLTDTNAWFLTTDVPNGMKHFIRTPLAQSMDGDFDTGNVRYKARERYSFGWSDPLGMYGSQGA